MLISNVKISIIVPVYNIEQYVERCLLSLLAQTYKNIEIIVVIDGSKDTSYEICQKIAKMDDRIKLIVQENKGVSAARNTGLSYATGEYVWFVDGDDWADAKCIEIVLPYLGQNIDIIMFSFMREYEKNLKPAMLFENDKMFKNDEKEMLVRRLIGPIGDELNAPHRMEDLNPVWNKIYRKSLLNDIEFVDMKEIGVEDLWFNINVFQKSKKIFYLNQKLYYYNKRNGNSLTRAYDDKLFVKWKKLYSYIERFIIDNEQGEEYNQALYNREVINLLALTRNIVISNLDFNQKLLKLKLLLKDDIYCKAFKIFRFEYLPIHWRIFYVCCKKEKVLFVYCYMITANSMRRIIK